MPAVSNTSPLFNLAAIGQLHLLREQFGEVFVPSAVLDELLPIREREEWEAIRQALEEGWISSREVEGRETLTTTYSIGLENIHLQLFVQRTGVIHQGPTDTFALKRRINEDGLQPHCRLAR